MTSFNIGDRVRVTRVVGMVNGPEVTELYVDREGEIKFTYSDGEYPIMIQFFDNGGASYFNPEELEHIDMIPDIEEPNDEDII